MSWKTKFNFVFFKCALREFGVVVWFFFLGGDGLTITLGKTAAKFKLVPQ